jgi:hypothetical protein
MAPARVVERHGRLMPIDDEWSLHPSVGNRWKIVGTGADAAVDAEQRPRLASFTDERGRGAAMKVQVFGTGCAACATLKANTEKAVAELGLPCSVEFESRILEMVRLGIAELPALVVDGVVKSTGRALDVPSVKAMLGQG